MSKSWDATPDDDQPQGTGGPAAASNGSERGFDSPPGVHEPKCPECGLPMSFLDDASSMPSAIWYCDGPNNNTDDTGCFHTMAARVVPVE